MYSSTLPSTSALDGVGGQRHALAVLPPGKTRYPLYRRLGGPQGRSGQVQKILPPTGIRSPYSPARSESLYRLSYPGPMEHVVTFICTGVLNKSLARPTSRCILFDGENISFEVSLVIYINSTNIPPIMIINRIYQNQTLLSL